MARIVALDYGARRTGIAVTDPLQIICSPLQTIESKEVISFLKDYLAKEDVMELVVGMPRNLDLSDTHGTSITEEFLKKLKIAFPDLKIQTVDERFTSKIAFQTILDSGIGKMKRRDKSLVDKVSAALILKTYLGH